MSFWFDALLSKSMTSIEPSQVQFAERHWIAQDRNRALIKRIAQDCQLALSGFRANEHLEIYYDINRGEQELGFISKGWDDPGFRIGDLIILPITKIDDFKSNVNEILAYCATNGMVITTSIEQEGFVIAIDGIIYCGGVNRLTLSAILITLRDCIEKVHSIFNRKTTKGLSIIRPLPFQH